MVREPPRSDRDESIAAALEQIMLRLPNVRRGKMFGKLAFFVGRRLFACLIDDGVAVRLSPPQAEHSKARLREFRPRGRRMTNWVLLEYGDVSTLADDLSLFERAAENVRC
jgi:hypothetical protein